VQCNKLLTVDRDTLLYISFVILLPVSYVVHVSAFWIAKTKKVMSRVFIVYTINRDEVLPFNAWNQLDVVLKYCINKFSTISVTHNYLFVYYKFNQQLIHYD